MVTATVFFLEKWCQVPFLEFVFLVVPFLPLLLRDEVFEAVEGAEDLGREHPDHRVRLVRGHVVD